MYNTNTNPAVIIMKLFNYRKAICIHIIHINKKADQLDRLFCLYVTLLQSKIRFSHQG